MSVNDNNNNNNRQPSERLLSGRNNRIEELAMQDVLTFYNYNRTNKIAYYLWFFLGLIGVHHLYLKRYLNFFLCIIWLWIIYSCTSLKIYALCVAGPYLLVWLIDGCRIRTLVKVANNCNVTNIKDKINPFSVYDMYLFWLPPVGFTGLHHLYNNYYWRFVTYVFSLGFLLIGWLVDLILIPCYYYPKAKKSFEDKINQIQNEAPKHEKTKGQLWMCWFPFNGLLGFHHFYCYDITLGICYLLTFGCWFIGWLFDSCMLHWYYDQYECSIEQQYEEWKKQERNDYAATNGRPSTFKPRYRKFKKTHYHSYLVWLSSGCLGFQHLYLENWVILLGHILTLGGCGIFWILDLFLMPSFIEYTNERKGFSTLKKIDVAEKVDNTSINKDAKKENIQLESINVEKKNENDSNEQKKDEEKVDTVERLESIKIDDTVDQSNTNRDNVTNNGNSNENEIKDNNKIQEIARKEEIEHQRALYTTYLYWTPLMGFIGVYYIYLGEYKQFILRFFTMNFLFIGWIVDAFRIPGLVKKKLQNESSQNNNSQRENLIQQ